MDFWESRRGPQGQVCFKLFTDVATSAYTGQDKSVIRERYRNLTKDCLKAARLKTRLNCLEVWEARLKMQAADHIRRTVHQLMIREFDRLDASNSSGLQTLMTQRFFHTDGMELDVDERGVGNFYARAAADYARNTAKRLVQRQVEGLIVFGAHSLWNAATR